jgi:hypothetical protein
MTNDLDMTEANDAQVGQPWTPPTLMRLDAGDAELLVSQGADGAFGS